MNDKNNKDKKIKFKDKDDNNKEYELEVKEEEQTKDGKKFKNVKNGPFWKSAEMLKSDGSVDKKLSGGPAWLFWITISVGVIALFALLYFAFFRKKKNKHEEEVL